MTSSASSIQQDKKKGNSVSHALIESAVTAVADVCTYQSNIHQLSHALSGLMKLSQCESEELQLAPSTAEYRLSIFLASCKRNSLNIC